MECHFNFNSTYVPPCIKKKIISKYLLTTYYVLVTRCLGIQQ